MHAFFDDRELQTCLSHGAETSENRPYESATAAIQETVQGELGSANSDPDRGAKV